MQVQSFLPITPPLVIEAHGGRCVLLAFVIDIRDELQGMAVDFAGGPALWIPIADIVFPSPVVAGERLGTATNREGRRHQ